MPQSKPLIAPQKKIEYEAIRVRIDTELLAALDAHASAIESDRNYVIVEMIRAVLERDRPAKKLAAAKKAAGA
ncbi:MAG: hypothetical protein M3Z85_19270 [Acidobacteriota bacterium]|nr:hypothetical protein [Acidobacteriota bacterium]